MLCKIIFVINFFFVLHTVLTISGSRGGQYEGYPGYPSSGAGYEYDPYSRGTTHREDYPHYTPHTQAEYSAHYPDGAGK